MKVSIVHKERCNKALLKATRLKGSENALAKEIGVNRQNINYWKLSNTLPPYEEAAKICMATRGRVSIYDLRPDLEAFTREFVEYILKLAGNI